MDGRMRNALVSKVSKPSVNYSPGMGATRCKNCAHFEAPNRCEIVMGLIDPDYWCRRFERA
jgi:hypothetical protein